MFKLSPNKKGQVTFGSLAGIILTLGVTAVIGVVLAILVNNLQNTQTQNTSAWNVSRDSLSFFNNLTGQFGLLGTVIGLVLVVSVVIVVFRFKGGRGGGI